VAASGLVSLDGDLASRLLEVPVAAGVGQILGDEGRSLILGRPSSLRRWAASNLGQGRPSRRGGRPPTDLRPVARALAFTATTSAFHQRLVFERLMARYVPRAARRDLKPAAYLHLDPAERFPRVTVRNLAPGAGAAALFGPFRNRNAAARALAALHKRFALRPCDYEFDPAPDLALGLGCVYAQVRTCAAPCLSRMGEDAYRGLARDASRFLASPEARPEDTRTWIPEWTSAADARALIVEKGRGGVEMYPVVAGEVLEQHAVTVREEEIEGAVPGLNWTGADGNGHDRDWLAGWLNTPRRAGRYVVLDRPENDAAVVRLALATTAA